MPSFTHVNFNQHAFQIFTNFHFFIVVVSFFFSSYFYEVFPTTVLSTKLYFNKINGFTSLKGWLDVP